MSIEARLGFQKLIYSLRGQWARHLPLVQLRFRKTTLSNVDIKSRLRCEVLRLVLSDLCSQRLKIPETIGNKKLATILKPTCIACLDPLSPSM